MKIKAAILWERGQPLSVEDAELDPPGPGEVLVEIKAAGVCHSDLHPARDDWPMRTPLVLGHEGAGIVREVGAGVATREGRRSRGPLLVAGLRCLSVLRRRAGRCVRSPRQDHLSQPPAFGRHAAARARAGARSVSRHRLLCRLRRRRQKKGPSWSIATCRSTPSPRSAAPS